MILRRHARDGGLGWSQCEQIVFEIERKLKHTESGYPTLSNTHPGSSKSFCLMTTFLKQMFFKHPFHPSSDEKYSPALSWPCILRNTMLLGEVVRKRNIVLTCAHTLYLSFFLHGQNFWRIKFTLKNANFSR